MYTLCFILTPARTLLGQKKRGFGAGKWNGFGGKVQEGETLEAACRREVLEECGLTVTPKPAGFVQAKCATRSHHGLGVHLFTTTEFKGVPFESEEMKPQWFMRKEMPWDEMWETDKLWIPKLLKGEWVDVVVG